MKPISYILICILAMFIDLRAQNFATSQVNPFGLTQQVNRCSSAFVDINNDDLDIIFGFVRSNLVDCENIGTLSLTSFESFTISPFCLTAVSVDAIPILINNLINNEGDEDLIVRINCLSVGNCKLVITDIIKRISKDIDHAALDDNSFIDCGKLDYGVYTA